MRKALVKTKGFAFEEGEKLTVLGRILKVGDKLPNFVLEYANDGVVKKLRLSDLGDKLKIISVVNTVRTSVCNLETHRWEESLKDLPNNCVLITVSKEDPIDQEKWKKEEGISHIVASARKGTFDIDFGVGIEEWPDMPLRAMFVAGRSNRVLYTQYVADQMMEPDYEAVISALKK